MDHIEIACLHLYLQYYLDLYRYAPELRWLSSAIAEAAKAADVAGWEEEEWPEAVPGLEEEWPEAVPDLEEEWPDALVDLEERESIFCSGLVSSYCLKICSIRMAERRKIDSLIYLQVI